MEKRAQGRPSRAAGVVGRQKIIDEVRSILRTTRCVDTSRKSLAGALGITPALITYYFPNPDSLFEEIAVPVIEQHRITLSGIVNRRERPDKKMRDIIVELSDLYGRDGQILNLYKIVEAKHPEDYAELSTITTILSDFFACEDDGKADLNAVVLQGMVRGMCEWAERAAALENATSETAANSAWLAPICSIASALQTPKLTPFLSLQAAA